MTYVIVTAPKGAEITRNKGERPDFIMMSAWEGSPVYKRHGDEEGILCGDLSTMAVEMLRALRDNMESNPRADEDYLEFDPSSGARFNHYDPKYLTMSAHVYRLEKGKEPVWGNLRPLNKTEQAEVDRIEGYLRNAPCIPPRRGTKGRQKDCYLPGYKPPPIGFPGANLIFPKRGQVPGKKEHLSNCEHP
jgi:hypothetical protein